MRRRTSSTARCAARLVADVPVGVLLSGGLDSTLVAALARSARAKLKTFTVAYDSGAVNEDGPARDDRTPAGHPITTSCGSRRRGSASTCPPCSPAIDQPIADPALVALAAISQLAREHVTVAVGGEGADELFFGYPRYRWLARADRIGRLVPAPAPGPRQHGRSAAGSAGRVGRDRRRAASRVVAATQPRLDHRRSARRASPTSTGRACRSTRRTASCRDLVGDALG